MNTEGSVLHSVPECKKKTGIWAGRCIEVKKIRIFLKTLEVDTKKKKSMHINFIVLYYR